MEKTINIKVKVWRQAGPKAKGRFETYELKNISTDSSFLEMLDVLNEQLISQRQEPVAFDHDCREGICGACGLYINGHPHGKYKNTTTCQLHMRKFKNGETITIEPWRSEAFPIIKDLMVDRSALDRLIQSGGYVSVRTGGVPDANALPVNKHDADLSMDAASCIGCGACVATCKNGSAMLFVSAKFSQLALLPQGQVETYERVQKMVARMDELGFGNCSNTYACMAECPKGISVTNIARMNRQFLAAKIAEPLKK